jgi:hypothetical protein
MQLGTDVALWGKGERRLKGFLVDDEDEDEIPHFIAPERTRGTRRGNGR